MDKHQEQVKFADTRWSLTAGRQLLARRSVNLLLWFLVTVFPPVEAPRALIGQFVAAAARHVDQQASAFETSASHNVTTTRTRVLRGVAQSVVSATCARPSCVGFVARAAATRAPGAISAESAMFGPTRVARGPAEGPAEPPRRNIHGGG